MIHDTYEESSSYTVYILVIVIMKCLSPASDGLHLLTSLLIHLLCWLSCFPQWCSGHISCFLWVLPFPSGLVSNLLLLDASSHSYFVYKSADTSKCSWSWCSFWTSCKRTIILIIDMHPVSLHESNGWFCGQLNLYFTFYFLIKKTTHWLLKKSEKTCVGLF